MRLLLRPLPALCMALALTVAAAAGAAENLPILRVTTLQGEQKQGTQIEWKRDHLILDDQSLPWNELDLITLQTPRQLPSTTTQLLLKDGSWLAAQRISAIADGIRADTPLGSLELSLGAVVAWGPPQWVESQRGNAADLVLLDQDDSTVSGRVLGIRDEQLRIRSELAPEPLELPLTRVRGLHLALPVDRPRGIHLAALHLGGAGPTLLAPSDQGLVLQAHPKQQVEMDRISQLLVHGGRRVFLSDLQPARVEEEGAFGVVWNYAVNRNIDGSHLYLGGDRMHSGLVIHSRAILEWELNDRYLSLETLIGISDVVGLEGDCEVRIHGDERLLWERSSIRGGQEPKLIRLDLKGVNRLRVTVDYGARYDIGDHLVLGNAWLLTR